MESKTCTCGRYPGGDLCPTPSRCGFGTTSSHSLAELEWSAEAPSLPGHYWRYDLNETPVFGINPKVVFYGGPPQPVSTLFHWDSVRWSGPVVPPSLPQKG